jgi:alcohol dehydrogenase
MKGFSYQLGTRIELADGSSNGVGKEVRALGHKALVVTDRGVEAAGIVGPILESLASAGVDSAVYDDIAPNPRAESASAAARLAKNAACDVLVGVGGGSPIDTAKAAAILVAHGGVVQDYEGLGTVPGPVPPLVAIPTTAGTGTEVTCWAVITDTERHFKMSVGSPHIAPTVALVDPELTWGLPPHITASTGMDALSHAIEAYTATLCQPVSDSFALRSIELVATNLRQAYANGANREARYDMAVASMLGGLALGGSDIAAVHCMGEAIGGLYDVAHGVAMAIYLPVVVDYSCIAAPEKYARIAQALGEDVAGLSSLEAARRAGPALRQLAADVGIPTQAEAGVCAEDFVQLAKAAAANVSVGSNSRAVAEADFLKMFQGAQSF